MSRIDLVSKNLVTSSIRNFSKNCYQNSIEEIANFAKITRIFIAMWKDWAINMAKIVRTTNLTKFYTFWTILYPKITFYCLRQCYIYRWFIHPWIMKDSSPTTPIGKPLGGLFLFICPVKLSQYWLDWGSRLQWRLQQGPLPYNWHSFVCGRLYHQSLRRLITSQAKNKLQGSLLHSAWLLFLNHIMP